MPISFSVIQRGQPGVAGGGDKKYYAIARSNGELTVKELSGMIAEISTVSPIDTKAVLEGLLMVMKRQIAEGKIIRLGDFGSFSLTISSEGHEEERQVTANSIKKASLNFNPGADLKETLWNLKYHKVAGTNAVPEPPPGA